MGPPLASGVTLIVGVVSKSTSNAKLTRVAFVFCTPRKYVEPGTSGGVGPGLNVSAPPMEFSRRAKSPGPFVLEGVLVWLKNRFTGASAKISVLVANPAHDGTITA